MKCKTLQINGKPNPLNVTHNSFEVHWNRPTYAFLSRYIVYVRNVTAPEVREYTTRGRECSMKVNDLSFNTKFVVSVRACIGILKWPIGDESDVITTKHLAFKMKSRSTLLQFPQATPNSLPIYAVKCEVEKINVEKIRRIMIGMLFFCSTFYHEYKLPCSHFSPSFISCDANMFFNIKKIFTFKIFLVSNTRISNLYRINTSRWLTILVSIKCCL